MRALVWCAVSVLFVSASSAFGYGVTLKGGPLGGPLAQLEGTSSVITIPLIGGTFDISVALDAPPSGGAGLQGAQMQFTSNASASNPSINGPTASSNAGKASLATRFNGPGEWDADTSCSTPNINASTPLNGVPGGFYACGYSTTDWESAHTLMGWINITVPGVAVGRSFTISGVNVSGTDQSFTDVAGSPGTITINQVPEPATALLLVCTLPFLRRRRTA